MPIGSGRGERMSQLVLCPLTLAEANAFVARVHRHHGPTVGGKFAIGVAVAGEVVGVAIVGRPVARHLDDGWTVEVNRVATDGTDNACSMLYGAAWRAAKAMGYRRAVTYTLDSEEGGSLRGAGWKVVAEVNGRSWDCQSRPRVDKHPTQGKVRWEAPQSKTENPARATATTDAIPESQQGLAL